MNLIYLIFAIQTFLTAWFNSKLIRDVSGRDQYWHITQFYQQIFVYLMPGIILIIAGISIKQVISGYYTRLLAWALMYSFIYNSLLNIMRKLPIFHTGKYDLPLSIIVSSFIIGVLIMLYTLAQI